MTPSDLIQSEFDSYYGKYIFKNKPDIKLIDAYKEGGKKVVHFFSSIPVAKHSYSYAKGKWNIKEVFQHLIDTERIFSYRVFRIARRDKTPLAGFDQHTYSEPSLAFSKDMSTLIGEFKAVRFASISLLESLSEEDLNSTGISSDQKLSARAAAFVIPGHEIWHMDIIKERYM